MDTALLLGCLLPVSWAGITDIRKQIIPNVITYPVCLAGLGYALHQGRIAAALLAFALGFGLGLVFYLIGGMGAGDVKLMAALGPWLGPQHLFTSILLASGIAIVWGLVKLAVRKKLLSWSKEFVLGLARFGWSVILRRPDPRLLQFPRIDRDGVLPPTAVPFGACLAAAAWLAVKGGATFAVF